MNANQAQKNDTGKRYAVTISYYVTASSDSEAKKAATRKANQLNKEDDCCATADEIWETPFGHKKSRRVL